MILGSLQKDSRKRSWRLGSLETRLRIHSRRSNVELVASVAQFLQDLICICYLSKKDHRSHSQAKSDIPMIPTFPSFFSQLIRLSRDSSASFSLKPLALALLCEK